MLELLAPAGSMEALRAAVQNGANAVYLGCGEFNARRSAKNFTLQSLAEAVRYCHIRGVAVHLTLNTLLSDRELPDMAALIRQAALCGVDAFIVQDLGVVQLCHQVAPSVPIHGSTQMTIHNLAGVQLCAAKGLSRVVLSRELSREEIAYITKNSPIEIEIFAHGALCMCYSGQCYLSAAIGGRSGNRGRCAQPCRQSYGYGRWEDQYPLSLKDNCLVSYLKEIEALGVASVKLEGRMKRPEYVAAVTGVYRKALDTGRVTKTMMHTLYTAFNRQGFTDGYYAGRTGRQMFGVRENTREDSAFLKEMRQSYESAEQPLVPVRFRAQILRSGSAFSVQDPEGRTCKMLGPRPEPARNVALTEEYLRERFAKTGGTPYRCAGTETDLEPGLSLSAAAVNTVRRDLLNQLTALRARQESVPIGRPRRPVRVPGPREAPALTVQVTSREQITPKMLSMAPAVLYVPAFLLLQDPGWAEKLVRTVPVCAVLPRVIPDSRMPEVRSQMLTLRDLGIRQVLCGNLGHLLPAKECGMALRGDFGLNLFNSGSMADIAEMGLRSATLSFEMTLPQIRDISKSVPCELLIYGRLPLMITENCIIKGRSGNCSCQMSPTKLVDRTGAEFPVIRDGDTCRSVLLNGKKLYWLDRQDDLARLGLWATRLYFTTENPRETDRVLDSYQLRRPFDPGACTRGLYLRGVE